jgi:hypothetical protein
VLAAPYDARLSFLLVSELSAINAYLTSLSSLQETLHPVMAKTPA